MRIDVSAIVTFNKGKIIPIKVKGDFEKGEMVLKIDKVLYSQKNKLAGCLMYEFKCNSIIDNMMLEYWLKYDVDTCSWFIIM